MKKIRLSTFRKLTMGFLIFGMLPLIVFGIVFYAHYTTKSSKVMENNYSQINSYFAKNVEDLITAADEIMAKLYDYESEGISLIDVLKDESIEDHDKNLYIGKMMQSYAEQNDFVSSERMVDYKGNIYSFYRDQGKTLKNKGAEEFFTAFMPEIGTSLTKLNIFAATDESALTAGTDDFIISLFRNITDIRSVSGAGKDVIASYYVDIKLDSVKEIEEKMNTPQAKFFVYDPTAGRYVYSSDESNYVDGNDSLKNYINGELADNGIIYNKGKVVFYEKLDNCSYYSMLAVDKSEVTGILFQNQIIMILVVSFVLFAICILYMNFSNSVTKPVVALKKAMKKLRGGDLEVRAEINSNDEFEEIGEGFNKMVDDLRRYIAEVYVASICRKEAELNALKMQIKPHYLYNILDIIRMTALDNNDKETAELLESLATQLRYVIGNENERIMMADEMEMLKEYFKILKVRYQNDITLQINISDEISKLYILKMLLQPIVENAVKHGIKNKSGGAVALSANMEKDKLIINIMDNGIGISADKINHINDVLNVKKPGYTDPEGYLSVGMKNVYDRIKLSCGDEYGYEIQSLENTGTIVTFTLPIWTEKSAEDQDNDS
ncbi:MAG: sensor histidine kinase [Lachnospiraceae bacterium]|nr:sensor histidine kinase [Lachnospiraceae bacterium]